MFLLLTNTIPTFIKYGKFASHATNAAKLEVNENHPNARQVMPSKPPSEVLLYAYVQHAIM
jgi:hypothetical protein